MEFLFSERMNGLSGAATREIFKLLTRPEIVSFAGGFPATQCLPREAILQILNDILTSDQAIPALQYGSTEGFLSFREQTLQLAKDFGINANIDEIQTLSGGQQGIDLVSKAFLNKGDVVLVENPTYLTALQIFATYQAKVIGVNSNDDGLDLDDLEQKINQHKPKFLYVVPTFSNPTGKTYSVQNRKHIAQLTAKTNTMVLEDDPYSRLRFSGEVVPAIKSFDTVGNVIYVTSFSKILAPGLRCGAAIGNKDVIRKLTIGKQGADVATANLSQLIVANYLQKGYLKPAIQKSLPIYKERKDAMINTMQQYMPEECSYTNPDGGLFIWCNLSKNLNMVQLFPKAVEKNVAYIQGTVFHADGSGTNTFRLNYSNESVQRIQSGIKALATLMKEEIVKL